MGVHRYDICVPQMSAPNHCEVCGRNYEFVTSGPLGIGGVVKAIHPAGPCIPRSYEPDTSDIACEGCGKGIVRAEVRRRFCGECRSERRRASRLRCWKRTQNVEERCGVCPHCLTTFWTKRAKQVTCLSAKCKADHARYVALRWWRRSRNGETEVRAYTRRRVA